MEPISLSELSQKIQRQISDGFGGHSYWVIGEITNHSFQHNKGFHFFDLVEKEEGSLSLKAKLSATAWSLGGQKIQEFEKLTGQIFKNDIRVLALVQVDFHPVYGLKLTLLDLDSRFTLGALEQERQKNLERLVRECPDFIRLVNGGYITRNKELSLKRVIQRIAVVTSKNSAGFQDFEHTLIHNPYDYTFRMDPYFTLVQGEGNAEHVRNILLEIFRSGIPYDAVLILRGGGSSTDFLIFDTYGLGQIVAKFPIPIITGIGHQKNETIVDLMAHTATKTPTKVAEYILAHNREFELGLIRFRQEISLRTQKLLRDRQAAINRVEMDIINRTRNLLESLNLNLESRRNGIIQCARLSLFQKERDLLVEGQKIGTKPGYTLRMNLNSIQTHQDRIFLGAGQCILRKDLQLEHLRNMVRVLSPENIFKRGFAVVKKGGKIITHGESLIPGDHLEILLQYEELNVILENKFKRDGKEFDL